VTTRPAGLAVLMIGATLVSLLLANQRAEATPGTLAAGDVIVSWTES